MTVNGNDEGPATVPGVPEAAPEGDPGAGEVDRLAAKAQEALAAYMRMTQEQVDAAVRAMTLAGLERHLDLAKLAVGETGRGLVEDKVIKNMFATESVWHSIKRERTVGVIEENDLEGYMEVAEPVGVVAGVTPVTNPTSTVLFKSLICAKTRNPVIFGFHPAAQRCSAEAARIVRDAAIAAGAPEGCVQWIEYPSLDKTGELMRHPSVSLILATGGAGMVRSAYSAGKPALGVGPGNVPCYIHRSADLTRACTDLMISKTFDNGMICASEQAVIVDRAIAGRFEAIMADNLCRFLDPEETEKVTAFLFPQGGRALNGAAVGQTARWVAERSGVDVHPKTKILLAPLPEPSVRHPLSLETLMPVLAYFKVEDEEEGFAFARRMLELGGLGHSAVIHASDEALCARYGEEMKVGRVIVNSPSSQGAIGDIYNANTPSLTLGCGSFGRNSTTSNVSSVNLINRKRIARRQNNMQWFKVPPRIYFERGSVRYLEKMPDISKAFIVTDKAMKDLGYVDKVLYWLRKRPDRVHSFVFADVEPDPSLSTIRRGAEAMDLFGPDVIIALGGGSPIDAAKGMWLYYEHPDTDFDGLKLRFLDIRKRAFHFPNLGKKARLVAIPTTSGTGSEVTSFSVVTDKESGNVKYPLADYELTPDVAIIDPQFADTMPRHIAADTGMDVLTHAVESYVSVLASDYTDGLAVKAAELVMGYLERSWNDPGDREAREKLHNASCIAGMAFTNAFLGICHSLAHKLGGEYHIPHGRSVAILLPHVIAYNARKPEKFPIFPKYGESTAERRYAELARKLGLWHGDPAQDPSPGVAALAAAVRDLNARVSIPPSIRACGVEEKDFLAKVPVLAENAFEDQCTVSNPRYPLIKDLEDIYRRAYEGDETPIET
ncbi:MAG: bifunctional acetaldehyde-CoA/alcohol dehydrogenase [Deltaproteobacteria bacterium]|jgi:acetaldehyde dehydrogenase/alcohol dehydrogenase|nr:bifunctional acetaldehyde-CoA/alcohol dehydrogenase [Deltaproteobacteria bacterium]